ncbi:MAG TPA: hypothetical protein VLS89_01435, partial [Candidatus Nanopelagicales bacterium]|nr:hypothetical protein [Candidatus Nanopelagicales bacterium]
MLRLHACTRAALLALVTLTAAGCAHVPPGPVGAAAPPGGDTAAAQAGAAAPGAAGAGPIVPGAAGEAPGFDPARVTRVLDDPRLVAVRAAVDREAYGEAAKGLTG